MLAELLQDLCTYMPVEEGQAFWSMVGVISLAAFFSGFAHCSWMCGPLVMMQTCRRMERMPIQNTTELTRLQGAALLPYHLGRIVTYMLLGFIAGGVSAWITQELRMAFAVLMMAAGLGFMLSLVPVSVYPRKWRIGDKIATQFLENLRVFKVKHFFENPIGKNGFFLGLFLGFLPCGLIYATLVAAAATGDPLKGAGLMFFFGIATIPALFVVALVGQLSVQRFKKMMSLFSKTATVVAGGWLCLMAYNIVQTNQ